MTLRTTSRIHFAAALAECLAGEVIAPEHLVYDTVRRVWNGMIDKRPALIARCADADDVSAAVRFATEHDLPLAVRGGGHNVSETGVAGLALSGGVSHQRRRDGMTIGNLVAAEVVLADGRRVIASAGEHPGLFWALRGGGGNFGVVTAFELRLHRLGPEVFAVNVAYPVEEAARAARLARRGRGRARRAVDGRTRLVAARRRRAVPRAAGAPVRRRRRDVGGRRRRGRARHPAPASSRRRCST